MDERFVIIISGCYSRFTTLRHLKAFVYLMREHGFEDENLEVFYECHDGHVMVRVWDASCEESLDVTIGDLLQKAQE